jgi:hypothetical protein
MRCNYIVLMRWIVIYKYEVPGRALNLNTTKPWGSSPSRKNPHGRTGPGTSCSVVRNSDHQTTRLVFLSVYYLMFIILMMYVL